MMFADSAAETQTVADNHPDSYPTLIDVLRGSYWHRNVIQSMTWVRQ